MTLRKFLIFTFIFSLVCFGGSYIFAKQAGFKGYDNVGKFLAERYFASKDFSIEVAQEVKIPKQELTTLALDVAGQDVQIQSTGGDEIIIKLNGRVIAGADKDKATVPQIIQTSLTADSLKVTINQEALKTVVDSKGNGRSFHFDVNGVNFGSHVDLEVFLPREIKKLEVRSQSGDFKFINGEYEVVFVQTQSGDVKIDDTRAGEFEFDTSSGDLRGEIEALDLKGQTSSGDIRLEVDSLKPMIDVRTRSGDVNLNLEEEANFKLQANTSSGELRIFGKDQEDEHVFEGSFGAGEGLVKIETSSGDIRVGED